MRRAYGRGRCCRWWGDSDHLRIRLRRRLGAPAAAREGGEVDRDGPWLPSASRAVGPARRRTWAAPAATGNSWKRFATLTIGVVACASGAGLRSGTLRPQGRQHRAVVVGGSPRPPPQAPAGSPGSVVATVLLLRCGGAIGVSGGARGIAANVPLAVARQASPCHLRRADQASRSESCCESSGGWPLATMA